MAKTSRCDQEQGICQATPPFSGAGTDRKEPRIWQFCGAVFHGMFPSSKKTPESGRLRRWKELAASMDGWLGLYIVLCTVERCSQNKRARNNQERSPNKRGRNESRTGKCTSNPARQLLRAGGAPDGLAIGWRRDAAPEASTSGLKQGPLGDDRGGAYGAQLDSKSWRPSNRACSGRSLPGQPAQPTCRQPGFRAPLPSLINSTKASSRPGSRVASASPMSARRPRGSSDQPTSPAALSGSTAERGVGSAGERQALLGSVRSDGDRCLEWSGHQEEQRLRLPEGGFRRAAGHGSLGHSQQSDSGLASETGKAASLRRQASVPFSSLPPVFFV